MEDKTKVQKAWEEQSSKRWHELDEKPDVYYDPFTEGIEDYKSALRSEIEKLRDTYHISDQESDGYRYHQCLKFIELIDTVTPLKK